MMSKPPGTLTHLAINWDDVRRLERFVNGDEVTVVITWRNDATSMYDLGPESLNFFDHLMENWGVWRKNGLGVLAFNRAEQTS